MSKVNLLKETKKPPRPVSRAVIAIGNAGAGMIVWYVGKDIGYEIDSIGNAADELGLDMDGDELLDTGIHVWEGNYIYRGYGDDVTGEPKGKFREPNEAEWAAIRANQHPWANEVQCESCDRLINVEPHAPDCPELTLPDDDATPPTPDPPA